MDGFELTYAVNALGSFALTILLLQQSHLVSDARIVSVSSTGMYKGSQANKSPTSLNSPDLLDAFKDGELLPAGHMFKLYQRSKALQVVFTIELQERLQRDPRYRDAVVQCCHPGKPHTLLAPP